MMVTSVLTGMFFVMIVCVIHWWIDEEIRLSLLALLTGIYLIGWCFGEASSKMEILMNGEIEIQGNTYVIEEVISGDK